MGLIVTLNTLTFSVKSCNVYFVMQDVIVLIFVMLTVFMLIFVMQSAVMLNVFILSLVAPYLLAQANHRPSRNDVLEN
jgi:hypothetical protein